MKTWLIKDFSKLTGVSVRTLHHYDKVNLLKPSMRAQNEYRLYSETDLLKMQQIIALKFLGFSLKQIKQFLEKTINLADYFQIQSSLLQQKAASLLAAKEVIDQATNEYEIKKSVPWETIMKLVEVYKMTQNLENKWIADALNSEELKQYAAFEHDLKQRFTQDQKAKGETAWHELAQKIKQNLNADPSSAIGIELGRECMNWVNALYGKKHAKLRTAIWQKGFKQGKNANLHGMSMEMIAWLDKAIDCYWHSRINELAEKVNKLSDNLLLQQFKQLIEEMYGDNPDGASNLYEFALKNEHISELARKWLKNILN